MTPWPPATSCSRPTSSAGTRHPGCAALSTAIPVLSHRGRPAFSELVDRCEARAAELDDDYRLAVSRWLLGMTPDTDRELIRHAERHHEPYVLALATVRLAIDTAGDEPPSADDALHAAETIASSYDSQYIRDYAMAARGVHARVFGDLSVALDAGQRLLDSPPRSCRHGASGTSPSPGCWAVTRPPSPPPSARRSTPPPDRCPAPRNGPPSPCAGSDCFAATPWTPVRLTIDDPWLAPRPRRPRRRDGRTVSRRVLQAGGAASQAVAHAISRSRIEARMIGMKRCGWPTSTDSDSSPSTPSKRWPRSRRPTTASPKPSACSPPPTGSAPRPVTSGATPKSSAPMRGTRRRTSERRRGGGHRLAGRPHARLARGRRVRTTGTGRTGPAPAWLGQHHPDRAAGRRPRRRGADQRDRRTPPDGPRHREVAPRAHLRQDRLPQRAELAAAASKRQSQPHE